MSDNMIRTLVEFERTMAHGGAEARGADETYADLLDNAIDTYGADVHAMLDAERCIR